MSSLSAINSLLNSTTSTTPAVDLSSILAATVGASTPGIDVTSAVAAAIAAARAPEKIWAAQQATLASQTSALTAIQNATSALSTDLQSLDTLTGPLSTRTVTSSNSAAVTATAASGTVAGSHSVVVTNLATTGAWYSDLQPSSTSHLPVTSLTLTTSSGSSATIDTGGAILTLSDLAAAINGATDTTGKSLGLTATVVGSAAGSRLSIVSDTSGAAGDFSIASANFSGTTWTSPNIPVGESLGANSFNITVGGATTTVTTTSGETYAQLASAINALNLGVTATSSSGANGTNLSIASNDGVTPFSISEPSFGFAQAEAGTDASLTVDGVPITSSTNTLNGAIPGVTITLLGETSSAGASLTVASDASRSSTAINQLVTDYNTLVGLVNAQFNFSTSTNAEGVLSSDPTVRSLQSTLMQALSFVATPASGSTTVPTLASLGISASADGTLSLDSTIFNNALVNDPADVQNFFQGASLNGFAATLSSALESFSNPGNGAFTVDLNSISATNDDLTDETKNFEANYIAQQQTLLTAEYSQAEIALQQLPTEMAQINLELGNSSNGKS